MDRRRFLSQTAAAAVVAGSYSPLRLDAQQASAKVALLVGVNRYDKRIFIDKPLEYAERDVSELATELRTQGFAVRLLLGSSAGGDRATKANFDRVLQEVLAGRNARDVVLVGFAGHGQQMPLRDAQGQELKGPDGNPLEDAFFCPADAVMNEVSTLVSLTGLMETLNRKGGVNLVLVDACRDNPDPSRGQRSISGNELNGRLPVNTAIMFSCAAGQQAWETKDAGGGHGVFFYHVLEGLRGEAAKKNGDVTWGSLVEHVKDHTNAKAKEWLPKQADYASKRRKTDLASLPFQTPHELKNLIEQPVLARVDIRKPPRPPVRPALLRAPFTATEAGQAQQAWADYLGLPRTKRDSSSGVTMLLIPPGEFSMGSSQAERDQMLKLFAALKPEYVAGEQLHGVRLEQPFYLSAHEVTVGQYRKFVTATGYKTEAEKDGEGGYGWNESEGKFEGRKPQYTWRNPGFSQTDDHPVVNVSWVDAVAFCDWVGGQDGGSYRLPREAEWEYACRAGTTTAFWNGDDVELVSTIGNLADAGAKAKWINYPGFPYAKRSDGFVFTAPVGNYPSNAFGLYDMHGNVFEWCSDWYDEDYYGTSAASGPDPTGPSEGSFRVFRGGGWYLGAAYCRSALRYGIVPTGRGNDLGFRLALSFVGVPGKSDQDK